MSWKPIACFALSFLGGCSFSSDYNGGLFKCSDGVCPSGDFCFAGFCRNDDAAVLDTTPPELSCETPGTVSDGAFGSTAGRMNNIIGMCAGTMQNGPDAVYRLDVVAGTHLDVDVTGDYPVDAYVIQPCAVAPATPACLDDLLATPGNPATLAIVTTGGAFIVVDGVDPALSGNYTLTTNLH